MEALPRILNGVERAIESDRGVALLAPLGYGKTGILHQTAQRHCGPVAWITMSRDHAEPRALLRAISRAMHDLGEVPPPGSEVTDLTDAFQAIAGSATERLLVLDDLDIITKSPAAMAVAQSALGGAPRNLRILYAASKRFNSVVSVIPAGVRRIGQDELSLSALEIDQLLAESLPRTKLDGEAIFRITGGWPMAVRHALDVLTYRPTAADRITELIEDGASPSIERMLQDLPPEMSMTLPLLASLPWFDHDLMKVFGVDAGADYTAMLSDEMPILNRSGARVSGGQLVGRCISMRLGVTLEPRRLATVRDWYMARGDVSAAVEVVLRHEPSMADVSAFVTAVENASSRGAWREVLGLSEAWRRAGKDHPLLSEVACAEAQLHVGHHGDAADSAARCLADQSLQRSERGRLMLVRTIALQLSGRPAMAIRESVSLRGLVPHLSPAQRINALRNLGACHGRALSVHEASSYLVQALELAELERDMAEAALIAIDLSALELLRGRLGSALAYADTAVRMTGGGAHLVSAALARNNYAAAAATLGRYDAATDALDEADRSATVDGHPRVRSLLSATRAELLLDRGQPADALEVVRQARRLARAASDFDLELWCLGIELEALLARGSLTEAQDIAIRARELQPSCSPVWRYGCIMAEVKLWLKQGEMSMATRLCSNLVDDLDASPLIMEYARAQLLMGWIRFSTEGVRAAIPALSIVCAVVEETGSNYWLNRHVRSMREMFRALALGEYDAVYAGLAAPDALVRGLPSSGSTLGGHPADPDPKNLTERERQIAVALCEGLSRDNVSRRLGLSRSTIDKAVSQLYAVTGFTSCHQVVAWAYRCGMFPSSESDS